MRCYRRVEAGLTEHRLHAEGKAAQSLHQLYMTATSRRHDILSEKVHLNWASNCCVQKIQDGDNNID